MDFGKFFYQFIAKPDLGIIEYYVDLFYSLQKMLRLVSRKCKFEDNALIWNNHNL